MRCCLLCTKNCDQLEKKSDKEDDKILPIKIGKFAELLATKDGNQDNTQVQKEDIKSPEGGGGGGEGCSGTKLPVEEKQTRVLKVQTCCVECQKKISKVLLKIDGVYAIDLDIKEEKVTVTGNVDPAILIKKLRKIGKVAELLAPTDNNQENTQPQKEDVESQEGGSGGGEGCSATK
ncbi:unnamed protein product, partial [Musa textilis]